MALTVCTIEQAEVWDSVVRSFTQYDVYYLSGYVKALQLHGDGKPLLFYYEGQNLRGINVVMKRDIAEDAHFTEKLPKGQYFDFATPYGYGGWLLEGGGNASDLFNEYGQWCMTNGIVSEFIRFHPILSIRKDVIDFFDGTLARRTVGTNLELYSDPVNEEFTKSCKKNIRRALQRGVTWTITENPEKLTSFEDVYHATMDRNNASEYYYFRSEYFDSLVRSLKEHILLIEARIEDKLISAGIYLICNGFVHAHLTGTYREYLSCYPAYVLEYGIALWAKEHGYRMFHHGGGRSNLPDDSLYTFKQQFGKHTEFDFYLGKKIWHQDAYSNLENMRSDCLDDGFFPRYRA